MMAQPTRHGNRGQSPPLRPCGFYVHTSGGGLGSPAKQKQKLLGIPTLENTACLATVFQLFLFNAV